VTRCPTNYSPASGLETDRSDYVAGLYLVPLPGLSLVTQSRFDEHDWTLRRQDTLAMASYGPVSASAGYAFTRFDPLLGLEDTQQDILGSVSLRLTNYWTISGTTRFDIDDKKRIQDIYQIRYADECFVLSVSLIETFIENERLDLRPDHTVMVRFELKHIGEFNYRTDSLAHVFGDQNYGVKQ
jgi:LPS-assembly protein